jgi:hypothetical protein
MRALLFLLAACASDDGTVTLSFGWSSPPCAAGPSYTCDFDITKDEQISVGGGTRLR